MATGVDPWTRCWQTGHVPEERGSSGRDPGTIRAATRQKQTARPGVRGLGAGAGAGAVLWCWPRGERAGEDGRPVTGRRAAQGGRERSGPVQRVQSAMCPATTGGQPQVSARPISPRESRGRSPPHTIPLSRPSFFAGSPRVCALSIRTSAISVIPTLIGRSRPMQWPREDWQEG